jgi:hypothetical protein
LCWSWIFRQSARTRWLLLFLMLIPVLAACGTEPEDRLEASTSTPDAPTATLTWTPDTRPLTQTAAAELTAAFTPRPPPLTRSAPTLPPTFTPTLSLTPTPSPTPTVTPTHTPTLSAEALCERLEWPLESLDGQMVIPGERVLVASLQFDDRRPLRGGLLTVRIERESTGEVTDSVVESDAPILLPLASLPPDTYTWSISLTTEAYTAICQRSVTFTIAAPEASGTRTIEPAATEAD